MGFGILIASDDKLLDDDIVSCLVEARVEQSLDDPTRWALRFLDDISIKTGQPTISSMPEFQPGKTITIAVAEAGGPRIDVLVRGPLEEIDCNVTLGGPGSWVQFGGRDRRGEMDREVKLACWEGTASTAMTTVLLKDYGFIPAVEVTQEVYSFARNTLNQRSTDLEFVSALARKNNKCFWLEYEAFRQGRNRLRIFETANVRSSPRRGAEAAPVPLDKLPLTNKGVQLKLNVPAADCQNVTAFNLNVDLEASNAYEVDALTTNGREQRATGDDPQDPINKDSETVQEFAGGKRIIRPSGAGDRTALVPMAEAIVTEAGWFVNATLSTTVHMAGGVLRPHDIVPLTGISEAYDGNYQVAAVTHVINAADHLMDVTIRRNTVTKPKTLASKLAMTGAA